MDDRNLYTGPIGDEGDPWKTPLRPEDDLDDILDDDGVDERDIIYSDEDDDGEDFESDDGFEFIDDEPFDPDYGF
jgi:hypothetical protein